MPIPIASVRLMTPVPMIAAIISVNTIPGMLSMMSVIPMITLRTIPVTYPATSPRPMPMTAANEPDRRLTYMDTLPPYMTRLSTSLPRKSVPSQWLADGVCSFSTRFWAAGS